MIDKEKLAVMSDDELIKNIKKEKYINNEYTDELICRFTMFDEELQDIIEDLSYMEILKEIDKRNKTHFYEQLKNMKEMDPKIIQLDTDPETGIRHITKIIKIKQ